MNLIYIHVVGRFWFNIVLRCAYLCMVKIPMEKPSQLLRIKVPFILLHNIGREREKSEDYSTSIVNVCFARAARTHDENDN